MANIQNLQDKVKKANEKVEKCKGTIVRHEKQLEKKIATLEKVSERKVNLDDMDSYKWINGQSTHYYWEACDVTGKIDDIKGAKRKLSEAEQVLANWQAKLQKELDKEDFINNNIPQIIIDFVDQWKQKSYEWHIKMYASFLVYKEELLKKEAEALKECQHMSWRAREDFMKEKGLNKISARLANFAGATVMEMASYRDEAKRLAWLEKTLEEEKKAKLVDLMNRITGVVGTIVDATSLRVSQKGNLDGIIKGTKADAKIETIGAGGWNIQCFHYRTLVNKI